VSPKTFGDRQQAVAELLAQYPTDAQLVPFFMPSRFRGEHAAAPGYSWCPYPNPYWRPGEGRCMITAGNGITEDCPIASLEAFLDESFTYGAKTAARR